MADSGGGKIRNTRKNKARKPYNRPQNRSFFTRVTDSVKSLLTPFTPQWLRKTPATNTVTETGRALTVTRPSTSSYIPKEPSSSDIGFSTPPQTLDEGAGLEHRHHLSNNLQEKDPSSSRQPANKTASKESLEPAQKCEDILKLWSSSPNVGVPQNSMPSSSPQFNASLFTSSRNTSINRSTVRRRKVEYGGAMSASVVKMNTYLTPYRIPNIQKVHVKTTASNRSNMPPNTTDASMSSTAKKILDTLEKMSTPLNDARKIPSPRQQPRTSFSVMRRKRSLAASSHHKPDLSAPPTKGMTTLSPAKLRKPAYIPLDNSLSTKSIIKSTSESKTNTKFQASVSQSATRSLFPTPAISGAVGNRAGGKMKSQRKTAHYSAVQREEEQSLPSVPEIPFPISTSLPSFNLGRPGSTSTPAVSQSKSKLSSQHENPAEISFNFAKPSAKKVSSSVAANSDAPLTFGFSQPILHSAEKKSKEPASAFQVAKAITTNAESSKPVKVTSMSPAAIKSPPSLKQGSVMDVLGSKLAKPAEKPSGTKTVPVPMSIVSNPLVQKHKDQERGTHLLQNKETAMKFVAGVTDKPSGAKDSTDKAPEKPLLSSIIQSQSEKWSCDVCLVMNEKELSKCLACGAPKPSAEKKESVSLPLFPSQGDKWECEVCLIQSPQSVTMCPACKTPKPSSASKPGNVSQPKPQFSITQSQASKWTCNTCLLLNDQSLQKCAACEAPNPNAVKAPPTSSAFKPFSPGSSQEKKENWECDTCMVFNSPTALKCVACTADKPGTFSDAKNEVKLNFANTPKSLMSFGTTKKADSTSGNSSSSAGIKFGTSGGEKVTFGVSSASDKKEILFGSNQEKKSDSQPKIGFGVSSGNVSFGLSSSDSKSIKFGSDSKETNKVPVAFGAPSGAKISFSSSPAPFGSAASSSKPTSSDLESGKPPGAVEADSTEQPTKRLNTLPDIAQQSQTKRPTPQSSSPFQAVLNPLQPASTPKTVFGTGSPKPASNPGFKITGAIGLGSQGGAGFVFGAKSDTSVDAQEKSKQNTPAAPPFGGFGASSGQVKNVADSTSNSSAEKLLTGKLPAKAPVFGGFPSAAPAPSNPSPAPAFGLSQNAKLLPQPANPAASFSFGGKPDQSAAPSSNPSGGFNTEASSTTNPFGGSSKPAFKFGASDSGKAPSSGGFKFGSNPVQSAAAPDSSGQAAGASLFGGPAPASKPSTSGFQFTSQQADSSSSSLPKPFGGGSSSTNSAGFTGFQNTTQTSGFKFGASQDTNPSQTQPPPTFKFGASNNNQSQGSKPFQFGAQQTFSSPFNSGGNSNAPANPAPAFGSNSSAAPAGGGMFNIGQSGTNRSTTPSGGRVIRKAVRRQKR